MRRITYFLIFVAIVIILNGCSKKPAVKPQTDNTITIQGKAYPTVVIGHQTWTSANYDGPGGVLYQAPTGQTEDETIFSKLYTYTEAESVQLPAGWRLPTADDYSKMLTYLSQNEIGLNDQHALALALMAKSTWAGGVTTGTSGFNAIAAGFFYSGANHYGFNALDLDAEFLTSSVDSYGYHQSLEISYLGPNIPTAYITVAIPQANDRGSVLLVKDD